MTNWLSCILELDTVVKIIIFGTIIWVGLIFYNTTLYLYLSHRAERRAVDQQRENI